MFGGSSPLLMFIIDNRGQLPDCLASSNDVRQISFAPFESDATNSVIRIGLCLLSFRFSIRFIVVSVVRTFFPPLFSYGA